MECIIMNNIFFINPCLRKDAKIKYPPVGLACVLTSLKKEGYSFDLIDMDANNIGLDCLKKMISGKNYKICGIGCIVTAFSVLKQIVEVVRNECPGCVIIAGNSVATTVPELLLKNTEVDIAVCGEGDLTIVELVNALTTGVDYRNVSGIAYLAEDKCIFTDKRDVIPCLDDIGFPDWDIFELKKYSSGMCKLSVSDCENQVVFPLNAARGCPYSCTFCYHVFKGEKYRKYSEDIVMQEFERLTKVYGATFIQFWDELTFPDIKSVEKMVLSLEKLDFVTEWEGITRCGLFSFKDRDLLKRMHNCGCKSIAFSIENASANILKSMNKKIDHSKTIEHSLALHEAGITPLTSVIFGYPEETEKTIKDTLYLCRECNIFPSVGFLQPLPGTVMYTYALEKGFIKDELAYLLQSGDRQDLHVNMTQMSDDFFVEFVASELNLLAKEMGLSFKNPLKTGVYQKSKV